ncbi:MAG: copper homeostasis periplasmic binding protein CopC [Caulobacteraceae bacterium]|nr:copper homeostasis periplasmic binding protein CopC [Caulobacteraceae bacterium]
MNRPACALLAAVLAVLGGAALAHPLPRAATPAPNAVLAAAPPQIRITFSERLVPAFSGLELRDAAGKQIPMGPAAVDPNDETELAAPVKGQLAAGTYTVNWRAVGDDTHRVSGHYSFQVK